MYAYRNQTCDHMYCCSEIVRSTPLPYLLHRLNSIAACKVGHRPCHSKVCLYSPLHTCTEPLHEFHRPRTSLHGKSAGMYARRRASDRHIICRNSNRLNSPSLRTSSVQTLCHRNSSAQGPSGRTEDRGQHDREVHTDEDMLSAFDALYCRFVHKNAVAIL